MLPITNREVYLPEDFYWIDMAAIPCNLVAQITVGTVIQWADRYQAHPVPQEQRFFPSEGSFPVEPHQREVFTDTLLAWFEEWSGRKHQADLRLFQGEQLILEQRRNEPWMILTLNRDELISLQDQWEHYGLPRDLYYPARLRKSAVELVKRHGGVVRVKQSYTPLQWEHRLSGSVEVLQVPSEEERTQAFIQVCLEFLQVLRLRMAELSEPGREPQWEEFRKLGQLLRNLTFALHWARGFQAPPTEESGKILKDHEAPAPFSQDETDGKEATSNLSTNTRQQYWLDEYYFAPNKTEGVEPPKDLLRRAIAVTARLVSHWATSYEAYSHLRRLPSDQKRTGYLPQDQWAREAHIDNLFNWLEQQEVPLSASVVYLFQDDTPIFLIQDNTVSVFLTAREFVELQDAWEQHGLPRDLYYSARNQYAIIEPVERHGGIVRAYQYYSPLQWEQRIKAAVEPLQVPDEVQRVETFAKACEHFAQALRLRIAELSEPGQEPDRAAIQRLRNLHQAVTLAALRAQESLLPRTDEEDQ